jgi:hypothetical protein
MRAWLSPLLLALALASQDARGEMPELWRWIYPDGVVRYTPNPNHVPAAQRGTLVRVEPGMVKPPEPEHVVKPAAIFVPPGEPVLEADPFNAPAPARRVEAEIAAPVPLQTDPPAARPAPAAATAPAAAAAPAPRPAAAGTAPASDVVPIAAVEPEIVSLDAPSDETAPVAAAPPPTLPVASVPPELPRAVVASEAAPVAVVAPEALPVAVVAPEPPQAAAAALPPELEARRAQLVAEIARDEEALKAHVSAAGDQPLSASPELREIAHRLPALQAELRALEAQQDPR